MTPGQAATFKRMKDRENMEKFAVRLIKNFQRNLKELDVKDSGNLHNRFKHRLHLDSKGMVQKITIYHLEYGMFVDMGVGRGTTLDDIGYQRIGKSMLGKKIGNRRAKRWYLKMIYQQTIRLASYVQNTRGNYYAASFTQMIRELPDVVVHS